MICRGRERILKIIASRWRFKRPIDDIERGITTYDELKPLAGTLAKTLKELGLAKIMTEGEVEFNPDLHDAVVVEGEGEREIISETLRPGYYYDSVVLRPAMVKVKKI